MKRKTLAAAIITTMMGAGLLGMSSVSAHGMWGWGGPQLSADDLASRQQTMFEEQAKILGISVDEVKAAWAEGKTMQELIKEKNLNATDIQARMHTQRQQQMKDQLQTLVSKGIITQSQADARLKIMETRSAEGKGRMGKGMMRGGMGFGF